MICKGESLFSHKYCIHPLMRYFNIQYSCAGAQGLFRPNENWFKEFSI